MIHSARPLALLVAAGLAACGGARARPVDADDDPEFACKGRRADYAVTGGLMSHHESGLVEPEAGVTVSCAEGPRLDKWRLVDGGRRSASHSLTPDQFETFWREIESVGWRNLRDCRNPSAAADDPVHQFTLADDDASVELTCPGKQLPFPFDRLRNNFDLTAAAYDD